MNLARLLNVDQIILEMNASHHAEAIDELVDHLIRCGQFNEGDRKHLIGELGKREDRFSTGIGSGVAIPHAFSPRTEKVEAVFGRSRKGIDFEALDGAPVHNVVLFVVPKKDYHLHLRTLAAIAKLFTNPEIREQLAAASTRREIHEIFASRPARA